MRETGRAEKRARILEAASRVFASKGFFAATVAEVAREAKVADGTIYLYFRSKDDLLLRLVEARMNALCRAMQEVLAPIEDPVEKLSAFIRYHLEMVERSPEEAQVLIVELRQSGPDLKRELAELMRPYLAMLQRILEEGIARGVMRPLDPRAVRHAIFGALDEVALAWLLRGRRFDLAQNAEQLAELFVGGLAQTSPRSTP
nr:MAG: TetR family transcriptional regulator [Pseudomonadota bacterium]